MQHITAQCPTAGVSLFHFNNSTYQPCAHHLFSIMKKVKWMYIHHVSTRTLHFPCSAIPMYFLNEEWAQRNHGQSLEKLAGRGGLGILEILDNINKRKLSIRATTEEDKTELCSIIFKDFPQ